MLEHNNKIQNLNGIWKLIWDPENNGKEKGWNDAGKFPAGESHNITVPGQAQEVYPGKSGVFWYYRELSCEVDFKKGSRAFIRCQAVDYRCEVWLNGKFIGEHEGPETPFDLDVTGVLKKDGTNRLVMRIVVPKHSERIDGLILSEIPSANKNDAEYYSPGSPNNFGGIMRNIELIVRPAVMIAGAYITACPRTGKVDIELTVDSSLRDRTDLSISSVFSPRGENISVTDVSLEAECGPGINIYTLSCIIDAPQLWQLEKPSLYDTFIQISRQNSDGARETDSYSTRIGFRELKIENGYFILNGKRIFLKSTHSGGDISYFNLYYLKTAGFNTIRIISNNFNPELFDYCDDLGLMVYQEHRGAWLLGDSPKAEEYFYFSILESVKRDRNHASFTMIGLLNENYDNDAYRAAVSSLPKIRRLDPSRLVILSSGRWDFNLRVGSFANPFCDTFECGWGEEDPNHPLEKTKEWKPEDPLLPMAAGLGDIHIYPRMPMTWEVKEAILNVGKDSKPVFISEFGAGSQLNVLSDMRHAEQFGVSMNTPEMRTICAAVKSIKAAWEKFSLGDIYPSIDDFFTDSFTKSTRQRVITFDLVRGNPQFCGYNLTGIMDHALAGEGMWTIFGELKTNIIETMRDCWNPLRFCLLVNPDHAYSGQPLRIIVKLANEDALHPGTYPVTLRIWNNDGGTQWEHKTRVTIEEGRFAPFAYTVFDETINLKLKAGEYTLAADLESGGRPGNRRMKFLISDKSGLPAVSGKIYTLGTDSRQDAILRSTGAEIISLINADNINNNAAVIIGMDNNFDWDSLWTCIKNGTKALFLSPFVFAENGDTAAKLPAGIKQNGRLREMRDWLYHKEYVGLRNKILDGMQGPGILDWEYYGQLCNDYFFEGIKIPDDIAVVGIAVGYPGPGYDEGVIVGGYKFGEGYFMLNAMSVLENAGHPAADKLLRNLLNYILQNNPHLICKPPAVPAQPPIRPVELHIRY